MKVKILAALGVALIAGTIYYFQNRKRKPVATLPSKENERHHLTDVFSKAKAVAIGN